MKKLSFLLAVFLLGACASLELTPESSPARTLEICRNFKARTDAHLESFFRTEDETVIRGNLKGTFVQYRKGDRLVLLDILALEEEMSISFQFYFLDVDKIYSEVTIRYYEQDREDSRAGGSFLLTDNTLYLLEDETVQVLTEHARDDFIATLGDCGVKVPVE